MNGVVMLLHRDMPYDCALITHFNWIEKNLFSLSRWMACTPYQSVVFSLASGNKFETCWLLCLQQQLLLMPQCQPLFSHRLGRHNLLVADSMFSELNLPSLLVLTAVGLVPRGRTRMEVNSM